MAEMSPEDLAEARGCMIYNECWDQCVEVAKHDLESGEG